MRKLIAVLPLLCLGTVTSVEGQASSKIRKTLPAPHWTSVRTITPQQAKTLSDNISGMESLHPRKCVAHIVQRRDGGIGVWMEVDTDVCVEFFPYMILPNGKTTILLHEDYLQLHSVRTEGL